MPTDARGGVPSGLGSAPDGHLRGKDASPPDPLGGAGGLTSGVDTTPSDLVDQTAATALERVSRLQARLGTVEPGPDPDHELDACRAEAHRLAVDIVSLRNAAELLKQELDRAV